MLPVAGRLVHTSRRLAEHKQLVGHRRSFFRQHRKIHLLPSNATAPEFRRFDSIQFHRKVNWLIWIFTLSQIERLRSAFCTRRVSGRTFLSAFSLLLPKSFFKLQNVQADSLCAHLILPSNRRELLDLDFWPFWSEQVFTLFAR